MKKKLFTAFLFLFMSGNLYSQSDDALNIFGYAQSVFQHNTGYELYLPNPLLGIIPGQTNQKVSVSATPKNSFLQSQLNLFFQKNFSGKFGDFGTFVNLEFTNNFSAEKNWGSFNLEEAWFKYSLSDAFNVKVGLIIPEFNNLNTIKNRTPYLPYVMRPWVYEAVIAELIPLEDFLPQKAFVQFNGKIPVGELLKINYALYVGNSENSYFNTKPSGLNYTGADTTTFKAIGGRVGLQYKDFKFGVSGTLDRDNRVLLFSGNKLEGNLPRTRIGLDLSFNLYGFSFESEYIGVNYGASDKHKEWLKTGYKNYLINRSILPTYNNLLALQQTIAAETNVNMKNLLLGQAAILQNNLATAAASFSANMSMLGSDIDKQFCYFSLGYNFTDELFAYGMYGFLKDELDNRFSGGCNQYNFGVTYKPIDNLVIKGQYLTLKFAEETGFKTDYFFVGASIMF